MEKTLNKDGSITTKWENSEGSHTLTENLPPTQPIFFYPWLKIPIPPQNN